MTHSMLVLLFAGLLSLFADVHSFSPVHVRSFAAVSVYRPVRRSRSSACSAIAMAGPATIEKPVVSKEKAEEKVTKKEGQGSEGWEVRLYNDPMNKREYVAKCLMEIVGLSEGSSYQVMMQAHQIGIAVIGRYHQERAELYKNSLSEHGLVCDMVPCDDE